MPFVLGNHNNNNDIIMTILMIGIMSAIMIGVVPVMARKTTISHKLNAIISYKIYLPP